MKAIAVTDQAAATAGMKLAERPEPHAGGIDFTVGASLPILNRTGESGTRCRLGIRGYCEETSDHTDYNHRAPRDTSRPAS
jgi:hypothetical protein